jgi:hypothetical protein
LGQAMSDIGKEKAKITAAANERGRGPVRRPL